MSPKLVDYYNRELQYLRQMGGEFARHHPKVGGRLGLTGSDCSDPHVERLLEGVAFLSARVHLKIDAEFPAFVDTLVGLVAPHLAAPTPSAMVARFEPDADQAALADGVCVPRGTLLRTPVEGAHSPCTFRTSRDLTLWPLELLAADYLPANDPRSSEVTGLGDAGCLIEIALRTTAGLRTGGVGLDTLPIQLTGGAGHANRLYELLLSGTTRVLVRDDRTPGRIVGTEAVVHPIGLEPDDSLFVDDHRVSHGHRLLAEYFVLPQKFTGLTLLGIGDAIRSLDTDRFSILLLPRGSDDGLRRRVTTCDFGLFCVPASNLFPKRADRCQINPSARDFHVVADRSRPTDFEIWSIQSVTGYRGQPLAAVPFVPAHGGRPPAATSEPTGLYGVERRRRVPSTRLNATRTGSPFLRSQSDDPEALGTEVFLTFTAPEGGPLDVDFKQVAIETYCTNRQLPLRIPSDADFQLTIALPVSRVTAVVGPTVPREPLVFGGGNSGWKFISHLSMNYLSLLDEAGGKSSAALAELLSLYTRPDERADRREVDGLQSITARPVVSKLPIAGPLVYGRGLAVDITCDEDCFAGQRSLLFASIVERFLAEYVSINSMVQTTLRTQRGVLHSWPPRTGRRPVL